ncbi:hypothetical protein J3459_017199 [Metarhizium acridum]|nr:hypothetical protein J3459_017199 [Metarhizium acridum]
MSGADEGTSEERIPQQWEKIGEMIKALEAAARAHENELVIGSRAGGTSIVVGTEENGAVEIEILRTTTRTDTDKEPGIGIEVNTKTRIKNNVTTRIVQGDEMNLQVERYILGASYETDVLPDI